MGIRHSAMPIAQRLFLWCSRFFLWCSGIAMYNDSSLGKKLACTASFLRTSGTRTPCVTWCSFASGRTGTLLWACFGATGGMRAFGGRGDTELRRYIDTCVRAPFYMMLPNTHSKIMIDPLQRVAQVRKTLGSSLSISMQMLAEVGLPAKAQRRLGSGKCWSRSGGVGRDWDMSDPLWSEGGYIEPKPGQCWPASSTPFSSFEFGKDKSIEGVTIPQVRSIVSMPSSPSCFGALKELEI